MWIVSHVDRRR